MKPYTKSSVPADQDLTKRINRVVLPLLDFMGATLTYDIIYKFEDTLQDDADSIEYSAHVFRRYPYRLLYITFSRNMLKTFSDQELRDVILHEILHEQLAGDFQRALEREMLKLEIADSTASALTDRMNEECEDIIDRLTFYMRQAFLHKGVPK